MFFRWPWDGAATLLGPSGRPLATSPAVQGAARDYGGGGAQTAAQGRKGCRRAERAGNQHHAASPGTWTALPAGSSTQHQPRRPVVRAEADSAGGGPVGEGTRRGGPPVPAHDAGEWLHGKRQRVHTSGAERNRPPAPPPPFRSTGAASSSAQQQRRDPESGGAVQRQQRFPEATHSGRVSCL